MENKENDNVLHISTTDKTSFGRPVFKLDHEFHYNNRRFSIVVPAGFETDFASIPLIFGIFLQSANPKWAGLAVVHDYCYRTGCIDKKTADSVFLDHFKLAPIRISLIYIAVFLFGFLFYNRNKNKNE